MIKQSIMIFSLFSSLTLSKHAYSCGLEPEQYALEFVREELAGRRAQAPSSCLDSSHFKAIIPVHDPSGERATAIMKTVRSGSEQVHHVQLMSREMNHYRVDFEVQVRDGRRWISHEDSLEFIMTRDKVRGCALLLRSPRFHLRDQNCQ